MSNCNNNKRSLEDAVLPESKKQKILKNPMLRYYSDEERKYYSKLSNDEKEAITNLEIIIRDHNKEDVPLRFKILQSKINDDLKAIAISKFNHLASLDECSGEYHKIMHWIESMCKIPFGIYQNLPVKFDDPKEDIKMFLNKIKDHLDCKVYGHDIAKEHMIRLLAQWISNPNAKGIVIGIQGPMGCGKTTLVKEGICKVLGLPFALIPLGGATDVCYLEGHSYTYEGAIWGKIVDVLMKSKCMNPVIFFDELDKVSDTYKGQDIINNLIHLTDSSQNDSYTDKYFSDFTFDLSRSLIIFSYNHEENINPILKDRMIKIRTKGYTTKDKIQICHKHMIPEILKDFNFDKDVIKFSDNVLTDIINMIDEEQGVRNLKRALTDIVSKINLERILNDKDNMNEFNVSSEDIRKYVHKNKDDKTHTHMMYV